MTRIENTLNRIKELSHTMTRREISAEMKLSYGDICSICRLHGIEPQRRYKTVFWTDEMIEKVDALRKNGESFWKISGLIGSNPESVRQVCGRTGVFKYR